MQIKLYNTTDDNIKVNKTLSDEVVYNIKLKAETSIIEPTIILQTENYITSNYAYIEHFNRYYYIENVVVYPNNVYNISLRCDVLMSYKDDILNSYAYIEQQTNVNEYYNSDYQSEVRKEVDIYKSNVVLEEGKENILVAIGGV